MNLLKRIEWAGVWRYFNCDKFQFTWHSINRRLFTRIDYFMVPKGILDFVQDCEILPGVRSDHSFVMMTLALCKTLRGKGLWKMNCSYLTDTEYLNEINNILESAKTRLENLDPSLKLGSYKE